MAELKPAAIVRSRYGDPEAFGERWLEVVANIQSMPYGAKLYAIPEDQVLVPRELLERITAYTETLYDCEQRVSAIDELRTIVHAAAERAKSNQA